LPQMFFYNKTMCHAQHLDPYLQGQGDLRSTLSSRVRSITFLYMKGF
jgi:hypothetical protein